jgi:hypothetical protein
VKGHIAYDDCVNSLTFISNRRTFGPYGEEYGVPFELPAAAGGRIVGFHGRSNSDLDAIGTYSLRSEIVYILALKFVLKYSTF